MKFKFIGPNKMTTPLVGKTSPGDVVEYDDDDQRCARLLRSSFFKQIIEHNEKAEQQDKKSIEVKEED